MSLRDEIVRINEELRIERLRGERRIEKAKTKLHKAKRRSEKTISALYFERARLIAEEREAWESEVRRNGPAS